ncbi:hypothetical protein Tco_1089265 [Tanacetum coccineum]
MERAATTASSLEVEQDSGSGPRCQDTILGDIDAQTRFETTSKQFNDPPLSKVTTFRSGEDNMQLMELMTHSLIDKKKMIITESSIRSDLHLEDAEEDKRILLEHTPLFDTIMVQASKEVGEDSDHPTDSNQIPIVDQPSTSSQPKQKQKSKRKQRKEAEVAHDEIEHEQSVLHLEKAKSDQAIKIVSIKKRVDKLEKRRKFRTTGLKRLKKVGAAKRIESSYDSLGAQEDASKQGRRIEDIDADAEVTLVNETQERQDEDLMFGTGVLDGDEMFVDATTGEKDEQSTKLDDSTGGQAVTTTGVEDSALPTIPTTVEETLAQTLMEIKAAKPKAKGNVFHDLENQPERPLTKKDQVALDDDLARNIQAQLDAEIIEE